MSNQESPDKHWLCLKGEHDGATFEIWTDGRIKIEVGGSCHIRTVREWHDAAVQSFARSASEESTAAVDGLARLILSVMEVAPRALAMAILARANVKPPAREPVSPGTETFEYAAAPGVRSSEQQMTIGDERPDVLLGESRLEYTLRYFREACSAWSDVRDPDGSINEAKAEYASAIEARVKGAITELAATPSSSVEDMSEALRLARELVEWAEKYSVGYPPDGNEYSRAMHAIRDNTLTVCRALLAAKSVSATLECGHPAALLVKSVESDYKFCELCECRSQRNDAEKREAELLAERSAIIESCAKVCEARIDEEDRRGRLQGRSILGRCAAAIRAIDSSTPKR